MSKKNILPDLLLRKRNRRKNTRLLQIHTPNRIVESRYVKIGDIDQWVTIRGEDYHNPVLLFIHGGPASPYSIFSPLLRSWEKHFTIVQWDQRGAGKTFTRNGKDGSGTITFDRLAQDGIELAEYLCNKLRHQKVILIGSSAGSLIGIMMAKQRPDLFYAYVGTDQNAPDPQHQTYKVTLGAFRNAGNAKGVHLVEKMGPDPTRWSRKDFELRNQYLVKVINDVPNMIMDLMLPSMLSSPEHKFSDLIHIFKGMNYTLGHLFEELVAFDFDKVGLCFELPFFIMHGDQDIITPTATAQAYFDKIEAPFKEYVRIRNAGHLACFARPEQFLEELMKRVRPLAEGTENELQMG
ncbi:alpha/beta hydrolase [Paenibacillus sp. 7124]|uniref:Alpha/beta hydrolase n=1 Tax=Paenibacillus apii TaxID=1850370 RepID=A0A6M1PPE2_9BACL|nr:alpha/beta hydrolase [Paenibacillus apii]NGM84304.1 alpha/beta hydrolase [Paenibacillus apii]NJJ38252.1 alpha/beta hydrolase [Paenibacillus apii]